VVAWGQAATVGTMMVTVTVVAPVAAPAQPPTLVWALRVAAQTALAQWAAAWRLQRLRRWWARRREVPAASVLTWATCRWVGAGGIGGGDGSGHMPVVVVGCAGRPVQAVELLVPVGGR